MKKTTLVLLVVAVLTGLAVTFEAQQAPGVLDAAAAAIGEPRMQSVRYTATGNVYGFGQAIGPGQPWPRFTLTRYAVSLDYDATTMREEYARVDDEDPPLGGGAGPYNPATHQGGIRPIPFGEQSSARTASGRTDVARAQIWMMTPHGFLKAARAANASVEAATRDGRRVSTVSFAVGPYRLAGTLNDRDQVERVETRFYNNVLGDMLVEVLYSDYRDAGGGVQFPMRIVTRQGGFPTLDLRVATVQPNGAEPIEVRENAGGGAAGPPRVTAQRIADGVWFLDAGAPMSYLVEFADHLVVIEAPGNDARTDAVLAEVRRTVPNKPVRYVINSHHHSDHAGGLRGFVAQGITVITHELNKPYYERIFRNPHTLNPDNLARANRAPAVEGVGERRTLSDGTRTLEIHHIRGNYHDPALLMMYLPRERMLIQADAYNPRPADARPLPGPSAYTINLLENIQRLKLDVAQIVHIHGGIEPFENLVRAAGREGTRE